MGRLRSLALPMALMLLVIALLAGSGLAARSSLMIRGEEQEIRASKPSSGCERIESAADCGAAAAGCTWCEAYGRGVCLPSDNAKVLPPQFKCVGVRATAFPGPGGATDCAAHLDGEPCNDDAACTWCISSFGWDKGSCFAKDQAKFLPKRAHSARAEMFTCDNDASDSADVSKSTPETTTETTKTIKMGTADSASRRHPKPHPGPKPGPTPGPPALCGSLFLDTDCDDLEGCTWCINTFAQGKGACFALEEAKFLPKDTFKCDADVSAPTPKSKDAVSATYRYPYPGPKPGPTPGPGPGPTPGPPALCGSLFLDTDCDDLEGCTWCINKFAQGKGVCYALDEAKFLPKDAFECDTDVSKNAPASKAPGSAPYRYPYPGPGPRPGPGPQPGPGPMCGSQMDEDGCDDTDGCTWCVSAYGPGKGSCYTADEAKFLPKHFFDCDGDVSVRMPAAGTADPGVDKKHKPKPRPGPEPEPPGPGTLCGNEKERDDCDDTDGCVWCQSDWSPGMCYDEAAAKYLPQQFFKCDSKRADDDDDDDHDDDDDAPWIMAEAAATHANTVAQAAGTHGDGSTAAVVAAGGDGGSQGKRPGPKPGPEPAPPPPNCGGLMTNADCEDVDGCVWCKSAWSPGMCYDAAAAKYLPQQFFHCDAPRPKPKPRPSPSDDYDEDDDDDDDRRPGDNDDDDEDDDRRPSDRDDDDDDDDDDRRPADRDDDDDDDDDRRPADDGDDDRRSADRDDDDDDNDDDDRRPADRDDDDDDDRRPADRDDDDDRRPADRDDDDHDHHRRPADDDDDDEDDVGAGWLERRRRRRDHSPPPPAPGGDPTCANVTDNEDCDDTEGCVWCESEFGPGLCYTLAAAKYLPAALFTCDDKVPDAAAAAARKAGNAQHQARLWASERAASTACAGIEQEDACSDDSQCTWCVADMLGGKGACLKKSAAKILPPQMFTCDAAPEAKAVMPVAVAPAAHAVSKTDCMHFKEEDKCDYNSDCTWCVSTLLGKGACLTKEAAKLLPPKAFECDAVEASQPRQQRGATVQRVLEPAPSVKWAATKKTVTAAVTKASVTVASERKALDHRTAQFIFWAAAAASSANSDECSYRMKDGCGADSQCVWCTSPDLPTGFCYDMDFSGLLPMDVFHCDYPPAMRESRAREPVSSGGSGHAAARLRGGEREEQRREREKQERERKREAEEAAEEEEEEEEEEEGEEDEAVSRGGMGLDCEAVKDDIACDDNKECTWCTSSFMDKGACFPEAVAKYLPPQLFDCDDVPSRRRNDATCDKLPESDCVAPSCVWCTSAAVGGGCFSPEEAKKLPSAIFNCKTAPQ